MTPTTQNQDSYAALRIPEFRYWLCAGAFTTLANRALLVAIGYQIYEVSRSPLALGFLGLIEAIPTIGLALFGGHVADRNDRRRIVLITRAVSVLAAVCFALLSLDTQVLGLAGVYAVVFVAGLARGFADPATTAFEAQVLPRHLYANATTWIGTVGQTAAIVGPTLGGFALGWFGLTTVYILVAVLYASAWIFMWLIKPKPLPPMQPQESIWQSITIGIRYVFSSQILLGCMAIDLFAVLFGGGVALLPLFAADILQVGPEGLGVLVAAPSVGALVSMLWSTRRPPIRNTGKIFLSVVAGFGISVIVFALSTNFFISLLALAASGMFDGISMVIRETTMRLFSPEHLRGRIASVNWIFIGSSNELGAFESGLAANWLGAVPAVWIGGVITLLVVLTAMVLAPQLRDLNLESHLQPVEQPGAT
jgi:MFS family permease